MADPHNPAVICPGCGTVATVPGGYCASCGQRLPATPAVAQPVNPYAAASVVSSPHGGTLVKDPVIIKQAEAVIKDAGQVILAVLIGFMCTGLAAFVIGPYYLYRLHCWNRLAQRCPALVAAGAPLGSLEQRFQAAKGKLMVGVTIGAILFAIIVGALTMAIFTA